MPPYSGVCFMKALFFFILFPFTSNAFQIDSMIKVADSNNENHLIVTGNSSSREFLYITLSELISDENNQTKEIVYNADNISIWPIVAQPAEIIVSNGEQVKVDIVKKYEASSNDRVFGIMFTPDIINKNVTNKYNIPFGYKTWFIVPGTSKLTGRIDVYKGKEPYKYIINNDTNKVLDINIKSCDGAKKECLNNLLLKPWTKKNVTLENNKQSHVFIFYAYESGSKKEVKRISL